MSLLIVRKSYYYPPGDTSVTVGGYFAVPSIYVSDCFSAWLEPVTMTFEKWQQRKEMLDKAGVRVQTTKKFDAEFARWQDDHRRSPATTS